MKLLRFTNSCSVGLSNMDVTGRMTGANAATCGIAPAEPGAAAGLFFSTAPLMSDDGQQSGKQEKDPNSAE
jgi:hypothetical protein